MSGLVHDVYLFWSLRETISVKPSGRQFGVEGIKIITIIELKLSQLDLLKRPLRDSEGLDHDFG